MGDTGTRFAARGSARFAKWAGWGKPGTDPFAGRLRQQLVLTRLKTLCVVHPSVSKGFGLRHQRRTLCRVHEKLTPAPGQIVRRSISPRVSMHNNGSSQSRDRTWSRRRQVSTSLRRLGS